MERLMKALEEHNRAFSINELSHETGVHNITIRKYIRIIETVRREPDIEIIRTRHSIILRVNKGVHVVEQQEEDGE